MAQQCPGSAGVASRARQVGQAGRSAWAIEKWPLVCRQLGIRNKPLTAVRGRCRAKGSRVSRGHQKTQEMIEQRRKGCASPGWTRKTSTDKWQKHSTWLTLRGLDRRRRRHRLAGVLQVQASRLHSLAQSMRQSGCVAHSGRAGRGGRGAECLGEGEHKSGRW